MTKPYLHFCSLQRSQQYLQRWFHMDNTLCLDPKTHLECFEDKVSSLLTGGLSRDSRADSPLGGNKSIPNTSCHFKHCPECLRKWRFVVEEGPWLVFQNVKHIHRPHGMQTMRVPMITVWKRHVDLALGSQVYMPFPCQDKYVPWRSRYRTIGSHVKTPWSP